MTLELGEVKELEGNPESVEVGTGSGSLGSQSRALSERLEMGSAVRSGPSHKAVRAVLGQEGPEAGVDGWWRALTSLPDSH